MDEIRGQFHNLQRRSCGILNLNIRENSQTTANLEEKLCHFASSQHCRTLAQKQHHVLEIVTLVAFDVTLVQKEGGWRDHVPGAEFREKQNWKTVTEDNVAVVQRDQNGKTLLTEDDITVVQREQNWKTWLPEDDVAVVQRDENWKTCLKEDEDEVTVVQRDENWKPWLTEEGSQG